MEDFELIDNEPRIYVNPESNSFSGDVNDQHESEGIWLALAKTLWGKDYIPLDSHDRASLNMMFTILILVVMIVCISTYVFIKNRSSSSKQRKRVSDMLIREKMLRQSNGIDGIHDKTKKVE